METNLIKTELEKLAEEKKTLEKVTGNPDGTIHKAVTGMDNLFNEHIQNPLINAVGAVDSAIGKLGGTFDKIQDGKSIAGIFQNIKDKVGEIKGTPKKGRTNGKGLEGIISGLQNYARVIGENVGKTNGGTVSGWVKKIVNENVLVNSWIDEYVTENGNNFKDRTLSKDNEKTKAVKTAIQSRIQLQFNGVDENKKPKGLNGVAGTLAEIHKFHNAVSEQIKECLDPSEAENIVNQVQKNREVFNGSATDTSKYLRGAIESILAQLPVLIKNSGDEINTFADSNAGLGKLDDILRQTNDIFNQLTAATTLSQHPPHGQDESPAQAVDRTLQAVRNMVSGQDDDNITKRFTDHVKKPLETEVQKLPAAVGEFNSTAEQQIKEAARTAINKAAGEISDKSSGPIELGGANKLMEGFKTAHDNIQENLEKNLKGKVDAELPDDKPVGSTGTVVQPDKITITKDNFKDYNSHVEQDSIKGYETNNPDTLKGQLPEKIKSISKEGLKSLTDVIDDKVQGDQKIDNTTFENPVKAISKDLDEIAWLVDRSRGKAPSLPQPQPKDEDGIKDHLTKLKNALEQTGFNGVDKQGLDATKTAIEGLHNNQFKQQPAAIDTAVQEIKGELGELREKLQAKNGQPGNDVINTLKDLKTAGVEGKNSWTSNGKSLSGLGEIQDDLQEQNDLFSQQYWNIPADVKAIRLEMTTPQNKLYGEKENKIIGAFNDLKSTDLGDKYCKKKFNCKRAWKNQ
ncbi:Extracellular matrix-binding ebh, putative [Babesia ovata]|uniref:Extracellular matrix-binding ebh, putative n=1 Tax=Babesia ovata TaxID=189622 RepID=A0A2H6KDF9_9APIC|nr:Extracellular matrix-binding ebh, putative [Babesia ovata]GBE61032.1 Extracellular matrix-binding ebh, putative [Babesia ovata]